MCGILGAVNFGTMLTEALHRLASRGPDGWGEYVDDEQQVYLGHRRLSVIDLSDQGRQPMSLADDSLHLTYNGEVYNYQDLQARYFKTTDFRSRTDTEVILHAYRSLRESTPQHLRGMFAFGIYDKRNRKIFLCRDRLGIKPLYYYHKGHQFAFASELSSLKALPDVDLEIDPMGLDEYFRCGWIRAPFSAYKYIRKLKPAHSLVYDLGMGSITSNEPYWRLKDNLRPTFCGDEQSWIEAIEDKIREAIRIRLISDVPLGAFLSGGLDSSLVVALMAEMSNRPVKTFTIGFDYEGFDEREFARVVAEQYGTEHHVEVVRPDANAILPELIESFGEPFYDSSAIPTWYVAQIAKQHITVALSGDGGDEVFAGYDDYKRFHQYQWYQQRVPSPVRRTIRRLGKIVPPHMRGYGVLQRQGYDDVEFFHVMRDLFHRSQTADLYTAEFRQTVEERGTESYYEEILEEQDAQDSELITKLQLVNLHSFLPDDVLTKVDRMSMLHSLETRVPLLDHELVELAFSAPASVRYKDGNLKHILKQILRNKVPDKLIHRKKQGFGVPLSHWFRHEWKDYMYALIDDTRDDPFLRTSYVKKILDMHQKGGRDFGHALYTILVYKSWLVSGQRENFGGVGPAATLSCK